TLSSAVATVKVRTGLTDETGRFALDDIAAGAYNLTAFAPGFVSAVGSPGQPVYYRPGDSVTLQMVKGGVITGVVTASNGEAIAGIRVRALLVKEPNGGVARTRSLNPLQLLQDWKTDDRGVYRIFGLEPGSYLVSVGGKGLLNLSAISLEGYDNDAPTFYPSATRDTAVEVKVRGGEEAGGIDIRFREGRGHAISGAVSGKVTLTAYSALVVTLTHAATGGIYAFAPSLFSDSERTFAFDGVPDGEYDLVASVGYQSNDMMASRPRRVEVKGADVTGVELELGPVGSISGHLVLEKAQGADPKTCPLRSNSLTGETVIVARQDGKSKEPAKVSMSIASSPFSQTPDGVPDEKGEFKIQPLETGRYRLLADLPGENSFVRAITRPAPTQAGKPVDAARNGIDLKRSERLAGVILTVAEGAAGVGGRVVHSRQGASLPSNLRVHLVPAEKETDDEVLRFFEAPIDKDGAFSFKHVAPGRYFLLTKEEPEDESTVTEHQPAAWRGTTRRAKLRREAEAFNVPIQLSQCQRVTDQVLRYSPPQSTISPPR
ncbi:MAG TPA: hypothetical protein VGV87_13210, partial [Blastocatellia bacterium]|nr:hypothetical protein [Blastocatellia bacterium]